MCIVRFGCIWDRLVALQSSVQTGPKWCKTSCHEVVSEFFAINAPNPPHWTQNSGFIAFHTILVHLGPFGCVTKHSAKRAKLMQKFVPRGGVGCFHNERNRSTPLDSKIMFCTIWMHLGPFGCLTKLSAKRAELGQKFMSRSRVRIFRNERI